MCIIPELGIVFHRTPPLLKKTTKYSSSESHGLVSTRVKNTLCSQRSPYPVEQYEQDVSPWPAVTNSTTTSTEFHHLKAMLLTGMCGMQARHIITRNRWGPDATCMYTLCLHKHKS